MPLKDPLLRREYQKEYIKRYLKDPTARSKQYARNEKNDARYKEERDRLISDFRSSGCKLCPEAEACCLDAHHLDPSQKDFSIGDANRRKLSPERTRTELAKCICLCRNCHSKVHAGIKEFSL